MKLAPILLLLALVVASCAPQTAEQPQPEEPAVEAPSQLPEEVPEPEAPAEEAEVPVEGAAAVDSAEIEELLEDDLEEAISDLEKLE